MDLTVDADEDSMNSFAQINRNAFEDLHLKDESIPRPTARSLFSPAFHGVYQFTSAPQLPMLLKHINMKSPHMAYERPA